MDTETIRIKLDQAIETLFEKQPDIFEFTPETAETEWNLAYHLASELKHLFPGYDCDLELRKPAAGDKRPDIVLHKRNTHKFNLLVIELKRQKGKRELLREIKRSKSIGFRNPTPINLGQRSISTRT